MVDEMWTRKQVREFDDVLRETLDSVPGIQYVLSAMVPVDRTEGAEGHSGFDVVRASSENELQAMFSTMFASLLGNLPPDAPEDFVERVRRSAELWPLPDNARLEGDVQ
jgi:hypothetical protein